MRHWGVEYVKCKCNFDPAQEKAAMLLVYMAAVAEDSLLMERAPLRAPETVKATGLDVHVVLVMGCQGS